MICELKMKADGAKQRYTNFSEWIPNSASCHWVSISAVLIILRQANHWFSVLIDEVKICKIMNQQIVVKQAGEFWCVLQPHAAWSLLLCAIENHFHCFSSLVPRDAHIWKNSLEYDLKDEENKLVSCLNSLTR